MFTRVVHKLPGKEILKLWCCIKLFYLTEFVIYGSWFYMGWWEYISCAVIWTKWCNILYSGLFFALLHLQFISFHLKFDQRVVFQFINTLKEKFTQFRIRPLMIGEKGLKNNGMNISLYTVIYYMCFPFENWKEFSLVIFCVIKYPWFRRQSCNIYTSLMVYWFHSVWR